MVKVNKNAKHMKQAVRKSNKGRIVAIALAGVLTVGGVAGAVCAAGLGKVPAQAPAVTQMAEAAPTTKAATMKKAEAKPETGKTEAKKEADTKKSAAKPAATSNAKKAEAKTEAAKPAAKQTVKKAESKPAAKNAEAKPAAKPAAKKAEAKPAAKQASQPAAKPAAKQVQQQTAKKAEAPNQAVVKDSGLEAKFSREECIAKACAHVGAGGQAKGEAKNVTAKRIVGGGTVYYSVELDLGDVHYSVQVDAIGGDVISSDQVFAGTRTLLDRQGNPVEGTEQPADDVQSVKKAEAAKPAAQAEVAKAEAPKAEAPKAENAKTEATKAEAPKSEEAKGENAKQSKGEKTDANKGNDLQAKVSREECIRKACAHVGAGGQAKGPAKNVTAKQITGGGTVYYAVELDLGDVHYSVHVDAIDGSIISADQVHAGKRVLLDKQANPVEGTEQEA